MILKIGDLDLQGHIGLETSVDCRGAVASSGTDTQTIRFRFLSDCLLQHGDNRGGLSANHSLLPNMHQHVPVFRVNSCLTLSLFKMSGRYLVNCKL